MWTQTYNTCPTFHYENSLQPLPLSSQSHHGIEGKCNFPKSGSPPFEDAAHMNLSVCNGHRLFLHSLVLPTSILLLVWGCVLSPEHRGVDPLLSDFLGIDAWLPQRALWWLQSHTNIRQSSKGDATSPMLKHNCSLGRLLGQTSHHICQWTTPSTPLDSYNHLHFSTTFPTCICRSCPQPAITPLTRTGTPWARYSCVFSFLLWTSSMGEANRLIAPLSPKTSSSSSSDAAIMHYMAYPNPSFDDHSVQQTPPHTHILVFSIGLPLQLRVSLAILLLSTLTTSSQLLLPCSPILCFQSVHLPITIYSNATNLPLQKPVAHLRSLQAQWSSCSKPQPCFFFRCCRALPYFQKN